MARESSGEVMPRRHRVAALAQRHLGREASPAHRAAVSSGIGITSGFAVTESVRGGIALAPHLSALHVLEPGGIAIAAAAGASLIVNGFTAGHMGDDDDRPPPLPGRGPLGPDPAVQEQIARVSRRAAAANSWIGRAGVACGVALGSAAGALDLAHQVAPHLAAEIAEAAEVFTGVGAVALISSRVWRRAIERGHLPKPGYSPTLYQ